MDELELPKSMRLNKRGGAYQKGRRFDDVKKMEVVAMYARLKEENLGAVVKCVDLADAAKVSCSYALKIINQIEDGEIFGEESAKKTKSTGPGVAGERSERDAEQTAELDDDEDGAEPQPKWLREVLVTIERVLPAAQELSIVSIDCQSMASSSDTSPIIGVDDEDAHAVACVMRSIARILCGRSCKKLIIMVEIGPPALEALGVVLADEHATIESLFLSWLDDEQLVALSHACSANGSLKHVKISGIWLCGKVGPVGATALQRAFQFHPSLERLDIEVLGVTAGASWKGLDAALANILLATSTLASLRVTASDSNNPACCSALNSVIATSAALTTNSTLKSLEVFDNSLIGDEGAIALAECLKYNGTLQCLNLGNTEIADAGAAALASALKVNASLKSLLLWGNEGMGRVGGLEMLKRVGSNDSLTTVALSGTAVDDRTLVQIQDRLA